MTVKPFVKWAGGKSQLIEEIRSKYPLELGGTVTRYCEPFVGGGAVLLDLLSNYHLREVLINDINEELINTYTQIKYNIDFLINELQNLENQYLPLASDERKEFYYKNRDRFNYLKINGDKDAALEKAALFILLNKTCFNGLFRVNRHGLFNVPAGAYKKPIICDSANLTNISAILQNVEIKCGDYQKCLGFINEKTFVYIDPPYRPITATAGFTAYTQIPFDDKEQISLRQFADKLHAAGAKVVLSNSDPKNSDLNDGFFDELYKKYNIMRVSAKRMINCNGESRGRINELLISNY